jgi:cyclophilin family peptidyl-prolyl cis-trans isomerase
MKSKILLFLFLGMLSIQAQTKKTDTSKKTSTEEGIFATILTKKGTIVVELEYQKTPVTVANFISLVEGKNTFVKETFKGKPFFDGLKFHRVISDFMIQGGDPSGNGSGGPGYSFKDEITDLKFDKGGILAMANSGPATNGSQFFITHKATPWLNERHTIFGHVTQGMDVVNQITQDDVMLKVTISRVGKLAKQFDAPKVFSDYFNNKAEDAKKQAIIDAENKKKKEALQAEALKNYNEKYADVISKKAAYFAAEKTTATKTMSTLEYKIIKKGTGVKPVDGSTIYFKYSGYFPDGNLFDSVYEEVCKEYGKYDENRANQGGYKAFPFQVGKKDGMIPGFIESLNLLSYGDKAIVYIPSQLAYGEKGAGEVIPPNTPLIFELEIVDQAELKK